MRTRSQVGAETAKNIVSVLIQSAVRIRLAKKKCSRLRAGARRTRNLLLRNMAFILNPYNTILDLSNKEDRKMFELGTKELEEKRRFNGRKEAFNDFAKLIGHKMKEIRVLEALEVAVEWTKASPSNATKVVNIFESTGNKSKKTEEH
eukprot:992677-Ditylum_brightwellii.AAC.1